MAEAKLVLTADDRASRTLRGLQAEMGRLEAAASNVGAVFSRAFAPLAVGAAAVGGTLAVFKSLVDGIDDLADTAVGLQVSAVALSEYRAAAAEAGVSAETLDGALAKLNVRITDAATGNAEAAAIFKGLGVSIKDAAGNLRSTEAIFADVSDAWVKLADGPAKAALGQEIFGKSAAKLGALLAGGGDNLRRFNGLTEETVAQAALMAAQFDRLANNTQRFKNEVAGSLIPTLNQLLEAGNRTPAPGSFWGRLTYLVSGQAARDFNRNLADVRQQAELFGNVQGGASSTSRNLDAQKILDDARRKPAAATKEQKDAVDDNTRAFARYVEELDKATRAGEELTRVQEAQRAIEQGRFGVLIPQQQELILLLAAEADARAKAVEQAKELAAVEAALERERVANESKVLDLAGITEANRKRELTGTLERMIATGQLTDPAAIEQAVKGIAGIKDELEKTSDAAEQFALVMTSALSDFFKNPTSAKSFFKALEADIMQLITQLLVLKPLAEAIKGTFSSGDLVGSFGKAFSSAGSGLEGLFSKIGGLFAGGFAEGGLIPRGQWGIVGERGPELAFGGASGMTVAPVRAGGAAPVINITVAGSTTRDSAQQIGAEVARVLARANARYN